MSAEQAKRLGGEGEQSPLKWMFLGVGLVATVVVTIIVSRIAIKALKKTRGK